MIRQEGNTWVLYDRDGTKVLGRHSTPESARKQETAILIRQGKITPEPKVKSAVGLLPWMIQELRRRARRKKEDKEKRGASDLLRASRPLGSPPVTEQSRDRSLSKTSAVKPEYSPFPHQAQTIQQLIDNDGVLVLDHGTGTGKTFTAIAGFEVLRGLGKAKRALVVVPTPLRQNFVENIERFTNATHQTVGAKEEQKQGYKYVTDVSQGPDLTVVGYEMFRKDPVGLMQRTGADTLIFDEFHKARDPGGKTWRAALEARKGARNFMGLTASIVNNDPNEIAPLLRIAQAGEFLTKQQFDRLYKRQTGEARGFFGGTRKTYTLVNMADLQKRVGPLLSHVDVADLRPEDMPRKEMHTVDVPMSPYQKTLYEFALNKLPPETIEKIRKNLPMSRAEAANVFSMIISARQASNSIHTLDKRVTPAQSSIATPKAKRMLDDALEHLEKVPDGKVVMYTNLVRGGVDVLDAGLDARGIPHGVFAGKGREVGGKEITDESRKKAVSDFQNGKTRVIILSGAGAEGLDLKNATLFQAMDGHFNPEKILQAEARARRLKGQAHRPPEERVVDVRRYRSVLPQPGFWSRLFGGSEKEFSTDEWIYATAQRKHVLNRMLRNAVRSVSLSVPKGPPPEVPIPRPTATPTSPTGSMGGSATGPEPRAPLRGPQSPAVRPQPPVGPKPPTPVAVAERRPAEPARMPRQTKYVRRFRDPRTGEYRYVYPKSISPPSVRTS